ncbi:MAG: hypothetical protein ACK559_22210, partial [bacterium]
QEVLDVVGPARVNHVAAEPKAGALVLEAVGLARRGATDASDSAAPATTAATAANRRGVLVVVERPAHLLEHVDLHRVGAIRRRQEEAVRVAAGRGRTLQAGARVGVGQHIGHDGADLRGPLLSQPIGRIAAQRSDLSAERVEALLVGGLLAVDGRRTDEC